MKRGLRLGLAGSLLLVTSWLCWDNVFSDVAPIQAQAEQAACTIKKCKDEHGMTKLDRSMIAQTFEFTWQDGIVRIECHREYWAFGTRNCVRAQ